MDLTERKESLQVRLLNLIQEFSVIENNKKENVNNISINSTNMNSKASNVLLPTISLPTFDGTFEMFANFKTSFENFMKCYPELLDSQKLFYLKSCLKGNAKSIETTDDTYDSLMKALTDRFENKRILIDTHINNIINYPNIIYESAKDLRYLLDNVNKNLRALKLLNYDRDNLSNVLLFNIIMPKLDKNSRMQFELTLGNQDVPDLDKFLEFIEKRSHVLDAISRNVPSKGHQQNKNPASLNTQRSKGLLTQSHITCVICKDCSHTIYKCSKFKNMSVSERYDAVLKNKLCKSCLHHSHSVYNCKSKGKCAFCHQTSHHTLLHRQSNENHFRKREESSAYNESHTPNIVSSSPSPENTLPENESNKPMTQPFRAALCNSTSASRFVLINTAIIYVRDSQNVKHPMLSILDSASQSNFITTEVANFLGLRRRKVCTLISGLNNKVFNVKSQITAEISDKNSEYRWSVDLLIVPKITHTNSSEYLNVSKLNIPKNIVLADPEFYIPHKI